MLPATQIKMGMIVKIKGEFCKVLSAQHQVTGRGSAKITLKFKSIKTGSNFENKYRSDEKLEPLRVESRELEYLYDSNEEYVFMWPDTYEQITLHEEEIEDIKQFLMPNFMYTIEFFEDKPIGIQPPRTVELKVIETEPRLKGATVSASLKPATLETGVVIGVPSFVEVDDVIRVDTVEKKYMERV